MALAVHPDDLLTYDDLQRLPDDGLRYELLDGKLLVSPSPNRAHQRAVLNVTVALVDSLPSGHEVLTAPFDWYVSDVTVFEPDVLVFRSDDSDGSKLSAPPLLAVEVLSPSTARRDRVRKLHAYARAGLAFYWIVDPAEPSLTAFRLAGERYVQDAVVVGDAEHLFGEPLAVKIRPGALVVPVNGSRR